MKICQILMIPGSWYSKFRDECSRVYVYLSSSSNAVLMNSSNLQWPRSRYLASWLSPNHRFHSRNFTSLIAPPIQKFNTDQVFFAMELLYFSQIGAVKLSILFFYLRLFPGPNIRKWIWGTIIFNTIFTLLFILIGLFQCAPIRFYWKRWDNEHKGKCMDINALGWANAGISIALDIWMLALPMTQLVNLNLHWKKKLSVAAMFGVGALSVSCSLLDLLLQKHIN